MQIVYESEHIEATIQDMPVSRQAARTVWSRNVHPKSEGCYEFALNSNFSGIDRISESRTGDERSHRSRK